MSGQQICKYSLKKNDVTSYCLKCQDKFIFFTEVSLGTAPSLPWRRYLINVKHKDEEGEVLLHHVDLGYTEKSTCCELEE